MRRMIDKHNDFGTIWTARTANFTIYLILEASSEKYDGNPKVVAKVAFKFPADGAGRLYAYVQWFGLPMVRGFAGGCGYDKRSAAVENAQRKIIVREEADRRIFDGEELKSFLKAIENAGGETWDRKLRDAGFTVIQAI